MGCRGGGKTLLDGCLYIPTPPPPPLSDSQNFKRKRCWKASILTFHYTDGKLIPKEGKRPTQLVTEPELGSRVLEDSFT